jgi:hypothetical protein
MNIQKLVLIAIIIHYVLFQMLMPFLPLKIKKNFTRTIEINN